MDGTPQLVVEGSETAVTFQNSEVREILQDEVKAAAYKSVEPAAVPVPEAEAAPAQQAIVIAQNSESAPALLTGFFELINMAKWLKLCL